MEKQGKGGPPPEIPPEYPPYKPPVTTPRKCEVSVAEAFEGSFIRIGIPRTASPIELKPNKSWEPIPNPALATEGIFLHDGSFIHSHLDLAVRSLGFPFHLVRTYRSHIVLNGLLGRGWDFNFNVFIVPTQPPVAEDTEFGWNEIFSDSGPSRGGDIFYHNGFGRKTFHAFKSWSRRTLRKCSPTDGALKQFNAIVTSYAINPGERHEIQRIAIYEGEPIWTKDEKVYYVRRSFDGSEQIFDCHGFIIALRDTNRNTIRIEYGNRDNPINNYKLLEAIVDSSGKRYTLDYYDSIQGLPRIKTLTETEPRDGQTPQGRQIEFLYNGNAELAEVLSPGGQNPENRITYRYKEGTVGLLTEIVNPREVAHPLLRDQRSYLENGYDASERVRTQRLGTGSYTFEYFESPERLDIEITDRRQRKKKIKMIPKQNTHVMEELSIVNSPDLIPGSDRREHPEPDEYKTIFGYDDDFQLTAIKHPSGRVERFRYKTDSERLLDRGEEREEVEEQEVTYFNDLSRGNLLFHSITSPNPDEGEQITSYTYNPFFNQPLTLSTPQGTMSLRYFSDEGACGSPEKNGNVNEIVHPSILNPDGSLTEAKEVLTYRRGGLVETHTDPDGVITKYEYEDKFGTLTWKIVDPNGLNITTSVTPDQRGNPEYITDARQNVYHQLFDERDNLQTLEDPSGHVWDSYYDQNDMLVRVDHQIVDDPADFQYEQQPPTGFTKKYEYDLLNRLVAEEIDPEPDSLRPSEARIRIEYEYDPEGNLRFERTPRATGRRPEERAAVIECKYDSRGRLFAKTIAPGNRDESTTYYSYNLDGQLDLVIGPEGGRWTYNYDGFGKLREAVNPIGAKRTYVWSPSLRAVRTQVYGPLGGPAPMNREGRNNKLLSDIVTVFNSYDKPVQEIAYRFDPERGLEPGAQRVVTAFFYKPSGRLEVLVDPEGRRTVYTHDGAGRVQSILYPGGHSVEYELNPDGSVHREKRTELPEGTSQLGTPPPLVIAVERVYDPLGRVRNENIAGVGKVEYAYDSRGLIRSIKTSDGAVKYLKYDFAGRKTEQIVEVAKNDFHVDPTNSDNPRVKIVNRTEYNKNGQPVSMIDGKGNITRYTYDPLGRLVSVEDGDGRRTTARFDREGRPEVVTLRSQDQIKYEFDSAGRLRSRYLFSNDPASLRQEFEYDGLERLTRVTDNGGRGSEVSMKYDSLGRLTKETQDSIPIEYQYDLSGFRNLIRYPSGVDVVIRPLLSGRAGVILRQGEQVLAEYSYLGARVDERRVPLIVKRPSNSEVVPTPFNLIKKLTYSEAGQLRTGQYVIRNEVTDPTDPQDIILYDFARFTYDRLGRLASRQQVATGFPFTNNYEYDGANRLTRTVTDPVSDQPNVLRIVSNTEYDAANNARRVVTEVTRQSTTDKMVTETTPNLANTPSVIVRTVDGGMREQQTLRIDANGNITETRLTVRNPLRLSRIFRAIRTCVFDEFGRLQQVHIRSDTPGGPNGDITYTYDGLGRRLQRKELITVGSGRRTRTRSLITRYLFAGGRCIEEWEREGEEDPIESTRRYFYGIRDNEVIALEMDEATIGEDIDDDGTVGGDIAFAFLDDHDGTPLGLAPLESQGTRLRTLIERYSTTSTGETLRFRFRETDDPVAIARSITGHPIGQQGRFFHDFEGLYYYDSRFYDPVLGVYISRDPGGSWYDPFAFGNAYTRAGNNPIMFGDNGNAIQVLALLGVVGLYVTFTLVTAAVETAIEKSVDEVFGEGDLSLTSAFARNFVVGLGTNFIPGSLVGRTVGKRLARLVFSAGAGRVGYRYGYLVGGYFARTAGASFVEYGVEQSSLGSGAGLGSVVAGNIGGDILGAAVRRAAKGLIPNPVSPQRNVPFVPRTKTDVSKIAGTVKYGDLFEADLTATLPLARNLNKVTRQAAGSRRVDPSVKSIGRGGNFLTVDLLYGDDIVSVAASASSASTRIAFYKSKFFALWGVQGSTANFNRMLEDLRHHAVRALRVDEGEAEYLRRVKLWIPYEDAGPLIEALEEDVAAQELFEKYGKSAVVNSIVGWDWG